MAIPYYYHSGMQGAPQATDAARTIPDILAACLVTGFNTQSPSSGAVASGVLTLNYPTAHGYEPLAHIRLSGATPASANATWRVATVPAGNQLTLWAPGLPDGAITGAMTTQIAPAGWTEPIPPSADTRVFAQAAPSTGHWLRAQNPAGTICSLVGYKTMTDTNTGTGRFPAAGVLTPASSAPTPQLSWAVAATGKLFYLYLHRQSVWERGFACFGDLADPIKPGDQYHCILQANLDSGAVARDHQGVAPDTIFCYVISSGGATSSPLGQYRFLFGVPAGLNGALRGILPGAAHCLPAFPVGSTEMPLILNTAGVSGRLLPLCRPSGGSANIAIAIDEDWDAP